MYDNNSEYVIFDPEPTVILFGTPKMYLTILSSGETLKFEKKVTVGRFKDRELVLKDKSYVARCHATFIFEIDMLFLRDDNSTNGTCLNGVRIKSGKKYQLRENDIIDFATSEKVVFTTYMKSQKRKRDVSYIRDLLIDSYINSVIADKYHIYDRYGENAFHSIYLLTDMTNNKTCAVKIARKLNIGNYIFNRDAILKEAYILKNFQHPVMPFDG